MPSRANIGHAPDANYDRDQRGGVAPGFTGLEICSAKACSEVLRVFPVRALTVVPVAGDLARQVERHSAQRPVVAAVPAATGSSR
jgi:hypothetical protein